jgi:predicted  nucleic acid-binding Zn-ribbon protein
VIQRLGHPRVVALTATAALPVRRDIVQRLDLREHREVIASFDRPNLYLAVERFIDDADKRHSVITRVRALTADPAMRCGLVYAASRKDTEFYAGELGQCGVRVVAYHARMKAADRQRVHEQFLADELDVVVATSAFGMGIDKPDVRFVVHAAVPESLDSYYQQIGRAGRDGQPAEITLFYRQEDLSLQTFLTASKASQEVLGEVAQVLQGHHQPVRPVQLKDEVNGSAAKRTTAVNLLAQAGTVAITADGRLEYVDSGPLPIMPRQPGAGGSTCLATSASNRPARAVTVTRVRPEQPRNSLPVTASSLGGAQCDTAKGVRRRHVYRAGPADRAVRRRRLQDAIPAGHPRAQPACPRPRLRVSGACLGNRDGLAMS